MRGLSVARVDFILENSKVLVKPEVTAVPVVTEYPDKLVWKYLDVSHPESQGAPEQFHTNTKSDVKCTVWNCLEF